MQAHPAADIFRNRYGDCKDKTTLLISMLQAVGIQAFYVPVDDRRGVVDPDAPSFYGDHMITAIEIPADVNDPRLMAIVKAKDGKRYLIFDPRTSARPWAICLRMNRAATDSRGRSVKPVIALPVLPPGANGTERKAALRFQPTAR